jgi:hypothetical protein
VYVDWGAPVQNGLKEVEEPPKKPVESIVSSVNAVYKAVPKGAPKGVSNAVSVLHTKARCAGGAAIVDGCGIYYHKHDTEIVGKILAEFKQQWMVTHADPSKFLVSISDFSVC